MECCLTSPSDRIVARLLDWFDSRDRNVPWRGERDPYRIWVAEVMAQQTRVQTVAPYYARFIARFPTAGALATADLDEVLKLWEGLGYYARARHLHAAARQLVERHEGQVPASVEELRALSGVGPYTAGAVASMAFGIAEPAVDGNARRVLSRLFDLETPTPRRLDATARELLGATPRRPAAVNQAIMDLGGTVCTPRSPSCLDCPLVRECAAFTAGTIPDRPPKKARGPTPRRRATSAIVERGTRVLLIRRPDRGLLGGLWDLPGTAPLAEARSTGDRQEHHLVETLRDSFGIEFLPERISSTVQHTFSHFRLELTIRRGSWISGEPRWEPGWVWASSRELESLALPTYLRPVIPSLMGEVS